MGNKVKNVADQLWSDLVTVAGLFTSFCGAVGAVIAMVNACRPETLADLPKPKSKSYGTRL